MKKFIESLQLRWSDLFLLLGFLPFTLFLIFGQVFMQSINPEMVPFSIWAAIPCFIVSLGMWGIYLYLEFKRGLIVKNYITWIFVILAVVGVISIAIQPQLFSENVIVRMVNDGNKALYGESIQVGDVINVNFVISPVHYGFFAMDIVLILMFIYIGFFVFPRRFTSISFIKFLGYAVIALCGVLILYSYIFEHAKYIPFIMNLIGKGAEGEDIYTYAMISFIIHRNAYAMVLMIGIVFCFVNHSIERKWFYWPIVVFFLLNMIFTYCKTGLMITALIVMFYTIYYLITSYKEYPTRNRNILIALGALVVLGLIVVSISYISKGKVLGPIYSLITSVTESNTLDTRTYIWDNSYQLLRSNPAFVILGRGFGLFNLMLMPMNNVNGDNVFPSHSAYVGLLAEGGIIYLFAYLLFLGYSLYIIIKSYKKAPNLTISLSLGVLAFVLYSFIETIHYLVYVFMFPMFILYCLNYPQEEEAQSNI